MALRPTASSFTPYHCQQHLVSKCSLQATPLPFHSFEAGLYEEKAITPQTNDLNSCVLENPIDQKSWFIDNSLNETENSQRKLNQRQESEKCSKVDLKKRYKRIRKQQGRIEKGQINRVLEPYSLDSIPLPFEQLLKEEHNTKTLKKFYKILRKSMNKEKSRKICFDLTKKILQTGEWKQLLDEKRQQLNEGKCPFE